MLLQVDDDDKTNGFHYDSLIQWWWLLLQNLQANNCNGFFLSFFFFSMYHIICLYCWYSLSPEFLHSLGIFGFCLFFQHSSVHLIIIIIIANIIFLTKMIIFFSYESSTQMISVILIFLFKTMLYVNNANISFNSVINMES